MRNKTFSLVIISNYSLVLLPGISFLTTVDFGFHILLEQPFDFFSSPLPWCYQPNRQARHMQSFAVIPYAALGQL